MRLLTGVLGAALLGAWLGAAVAASAPASFADPALAARYDALLHELRCLVCQNQTLADSDAELAEDLRREVRRMLEAGQDDHAIIDFLVARYGDFVLYRPPLKGSTWLLWAGPFALLGLGAVVVTRLARRRAEAPVALADAEQARLRAALGELDDEPRGP